MSLSLLLSRVCVRSGSLPRQDRAQRLSKAINLRAPQLCCARQGQVAITIFDDMDVVGRINERFTAAFELRRQRGVGYQAHVDVHCKETIHVRELAADASIGQHG